MPAAPLSLVVLTAGLSHRYGGLKQVEAIGPAGELLLDYAVFDALRAGFKRVVFVIRPEMAAPFHPVAARFRGPLEVKLALQHLEDAPKGAAVRTRRKPWGTGHAVLAAEPHVPGGFAVCNADDFYGADAFRAARQFLADATAAQPTWALAGYPLETTLSAAGPVTRAVCRVSEGGWLHDLEERRVSAADAAPDITVSMNLWCFTQDVFAHLRAGFDAFAMHADPDAEYRLPDAVRDALRSGVARVKVLPHSGRWFGLTHPDDFTAVHSSLRELAAQGAYTSPLWP